MKLALYKGPPTDLQHWLGHMLVRLFTLSRYSHVELVIDCACWSSSYMDHGVRGKVIDLTSGRWDVIDIGGTPAQEQLAQAWFLAHVGWHYDWPGIVRFVLPFVAQHQGEFFCSEAVAAALIAAGLLPELDESGITPKNLAKHFSSPRLTASGIQ